VSIVADPVPVFLCVDVEPDERHAEPAHADSLRGVEAMFEHLEGLRPRLAAASGDPVRFLWFVRCDPQIADVYGAAGHLLTRYAGTFERLRAAGDGIGLHVHPWHRADGGGEWIADYGGTAWIEECTEVSFATYREHFGTACELHRFGDRWFGPDALPLLERLGVRFDLSIEPGAPGVRALAPGEASAGSIPDYVRAPRVPYRPSRTDFLRPDSEGGRGLWEIPLSSHDPSSALPLYRRVRRKVRRPFRPPHRPLPMFERWTSPQVFWDLVERHVDSLERPYLAFAIRSGNPDAPDESRVRTVLEHLLEHRLVSRLSFTHPEDGLRRMGYELESAPAGA